MGTTITGSPIADDEVIIESQVAAHNSVSQGLTPNGYLMESYTSGFWTVTKWADGRMVVDYYNGALSGFAITGAYGSLYQGEMTFTPPEASVTPWVGAGASVKYSTSASWANFRLSGSLTAVVIRAWDIASNSGSADSAVMFSAVGRWK